MWHRRVSQRSEQAKIAPKGTKHKKHIRWDRKRISDFNQRILWYLLRYKKATMRELGKFVYGGIDLPDHYYKIPIDYALRENLIEYFIPKLVTREARQLLRIKQNG